MKKRLIILDHNRGRLANQLWNFIGLYSFCLEMGYTPENYSFFDYADYFTMPLPKNIFIRLFFFSRISKKKWYRRFRLYDKYVKFIEWKHAGKIFFDGALGAFYLPPSLNKIPEQLERINQIMNSSDSVIYTHGWLFRNPVGIEKYRPQIIEYFKPKSFIADKVGNFFIDRRKRYAHIVGVHIRQTDYKIFHGGEYYFSQHEVHVFLKEYLQFYGKNPSEVLFVLCSDGSIDIGLFDGLNVEVPKGNMFEDLFTLAGADIIIGSNSTFGAFASYYGNIPFVIFERDGIDWAYYRDKKHYFENIKNTLIHY